MPQFSLKFPNEHSVQDAENPFKFHPSELEVIYKYDFEAQAWMIKGEDTLYASVVVIAQELEKRIDNPYCDWDTLSLYLEQLRVMEMTMSHINQQQWGLAEYEEAIQRTIKRTIELEDEIDEYEIKEEVRYKEEHPDEF